MKSIGITRKVDELGRVVIPMELRRNLGIEEGTPLEIFVENKDVILRKYVPGCFNCGEVEEVKVISGVCICKNCAKSILEKFKSEV